MKVEVIKTMTVCQVVDIDVTDLDLSIEEDSEELEDRAIKEANSQGNWSVEGSTEYDIHIED